MDDLIARIKQEKWYMRLTYEPHPGYFTCILKGESKMTGGISASSPESAIIDAIREMDGR